MNNEPSYGRKFWVAYLVCFVTIRLVYHLCIEQWYHATFLVNVALLYLATIIVVLYGVHKWS